MKNPLSPRYRQIMRMILIVIAVALLAYFLLIHLADIGHGISTFFSIIAPFLAGSLIAFILKPICNSLDIHLGNLFVKRVFRKRIAAGRTTEKRARSFAEKVSILIAMLVFALILFGVVMLVVPSVIDSLFILKDSVPAYLQQFNNWMETLNRPESPVASFIYRSYQTIIKSITEASGSFVENLLKNYMSIITTAGTVISFVLNFLVDILVTVVSAVYILYNRKRFAAQATLIVRATFKKSIADWLIKEAQFTNRKFSEFFTGKMIDSFIVGCILYIVMMIVHIPSAPLIAVFMAFCNMIPFFGPYIGAFPSMLIVLMADTAHPINVLYFLIIVVVVQQLDGNILDPYIVGDNVGLSSFWVLFAVMLFGDLFGFVGLLLGVPLFAVLYDLVRQLVNYGLKRRGEEQLMTNYNYIYHNPDEERDARKKRAAAIKASRKATRAKESAERQEALERELAVAQATAQARAEAQAEAEAKEQAQAEQASDQTAGAATQAAEQTKTDTAAEQEASSSTQQK